MFTFSIKLSQSQQATLPFNQSKEALQEPEFYHVIFLNDDYTPMDFVVQILRSLFDKNAQDAYCLMLQVHENKRAIVGTYPREVAEAKKDKVTMSARANQFPLDCIIERINE